MQDELNVVWITTPLLEEDWFRHLLSNFAANHVFDAHLRQPQPNSLYVVNSNILPLARIDPSFLRAVRHTPNVGLLHASDESFSQDYRYVRKFFVHHPHASRKIAQCAESCLDRPLRMAKRYSSGVLTKKDHRVILVEALPTSRRRQWPRPARTPGPGFASSSRPPTPMAWPGEEARPGATHTCWPTSAEKDPGGFPTVGAAGLEPTTSWSQTRRATVCATPRGIRAPRRPAPPKVWGSKSYSEGLLDLQPSFRLDPLNWRDRPRPPSLSDAVDH